MSPHEIALAIVVALWLAPVILVALCVLTMPREDRRREQPLGIDDWLDAEWKRFDELEQRARTEPATHAPRLQLAEQRATVIDLDSRRRARRTTGDAA